MRSTWFIYALAFFPVGIFLPADVHGDDIESLLDQGLPYFVQNYTPDHYEAHHQNWSVVEDTRGVVYVGNTHGVLEYDGSSWRLIRVGQGAVVRSLAVNEDGRVFVGAAGEFGYLAPDSTGRMQYRSLVEQVPPRHRSFDDVWGTHVTSDGVYFQTWFRLFRWDGELIESWQTRTRMSTSFTVRGGLYIWQHKKGLRYPEGDSLVSLPGGRTFADKPVYSVVPYGEQKMLVGTYSSGLYLYENQAVRPFDSDIDTFVSTKKLYSGQRVADSLYAFATLEAGVAVIDSRGRLRYLLNEDRGLQDERVYDLYADSQGGLWITLYSGVSRVVIPPAVRVIDQRRGLEGSVQDIVRHDGSLYVATTRGLYRHLNRSSPARRDFAPVAGTSAESYWSVISVEDGVLASANDGIYYVEDGDVTRVHGRRAFHLCRSDANPSRVFAGMKNGLISLYEYPSGWAAESEIQGVTEEVRSIVEDDEGTLWLGTRYEGVMHVSFGGGFSSTPTVRSYGAETRLRSGTVLVSELFGHELFLSRRGVFRANAQTGGQMTFARDTLVSRLIADAQSQPLLVKGDGSGQIWVVFDDAVEMYASASNGTFKSDPRWRLRFPDTRVFGNYVEERRIWFGTKDGLLRYTPDRDAHLSAPPSALVRRVTVNDDSLLFAGTYVEPGPTSERRTESARIPRLSSHENSVRFTYSAPSHNRPSATQYQYMLVGFDEHWSRWTTETTKEYTNLPAGGYRFRVRARTVNGEITRAGVFFFHVLPPWYRTWWAYSLYVVVLIGAVFRYGRYRASLSAEKLRQERRVTERLKKANSELRRANRLKDEFLANMSHELRTPLASILGFADLLDEELDGPQREFVQLIRESGDRLYNTLDSLLDLAKFRAGMVEPDYADINLVNEVESIVQLFEPKAEKKDLALKLTAEQPVIRADVDRFCLERILTNLVANAIKFTEEGQISVHVSGTDEEVILMVRDTGIGIDKDFLPDIFESFRQESSGTARTHQGVGLGLAITKRMVDLLSGSISVDSTKGVGTTFTIRLPRRQAPSKQQVDSAYQESASFEAAVG